MNSKLPIIAIVVCAILIVVSNVPNLLKPATFHSSSEIIGWGSNSRGQLGPLGYGLYNQPVRHLPTPGVELKQVVTGADFELFLDVDGVVWVLGQPVTSLEGDRFVVESDQLRRLIYQNPGVELYKEYKQLPKIVKIAASNQTALALDVNGRIWGWGSNLAGQLGDLATEHAYVPMIINDLEDVVDIELGYKFALARTKDGSVWGWGAKCEEGKTSEAYSALNILLEAGHDISGLGGYFDPSANQELTAANTCVGEGIVGFSSRTPVKLQINNVVSMKAGFGHSLFLRDDGTVWGVGCNLYGQVGVGYTGNKEANLLPQQISGLINIKQIAAGFRHSLAIDADGKLWAWGHNHGGMLGLGSEEPSNKPVVVPNAYFTYAVAGHDNSLGIDAEGKLWGWGENHGKILADDGDEFLKPVPINRISEPISRVSVGLLHIIIQK